MNLMIASDIHGSARYCRALLAAFAREGADRLLLLGDILYHGPRNDLPEEYAPKEVIALLNPLREKLLCVRGNCDSEVDQMVLEFPILADYCILYERGHMIFATHGHNFNKEKMPPLHTGDILLHGHHLTIPAWEPLPRRCNLPESRQCLFQNRTVPQLYDTEGRRVSVENTGWGELSPVEILNKRKNEETSP